jgi:DNA-binding MarR family transcriptional regulator
MDISTEIMALIHHLSAQAGRDADQILQEQLGIGLAQYKIKSSIEKEPNIKQMEIALALGQTEASVSRQIKLLKGNGMVASRINPGNRREHLSLLTPKGLNLVRAADRALANRHKTLVASLDGKQQAKLLESLFCIQKQIY